MIKLHAYPMGRLLIAISLALNAFAFSSRNMRTASADSNSSEPKREYAASENKIYDDGDSLWTYEGNWSESEISNAYQQKLHISNAVGSYAMISIAGSRLTLLFATAEEYGNLEVYVDDIRIDSIDQAQPEDSRQVAWESPEIGSGSHLVKFVHASGKSVNIDAIEVPVQDVNSTLTSTFAYEPTMSPTLLAMASSTPSESASQVPSQAPTLLPGLTPIVASTQIPALTGTEIPTIASSLTPPLPDKILPAATSGRIFYLSTTGSDLNPGSLAQPWKTISTASGRLSPGDTLYIRGGVYTQQVTISVSGTAAAPITIAGYPNEAVVFDGKGTFPSSAGSYMIRIKGHWVTVRDMEIANSGQSGVFSSGTHVTVQNMNIHHCKGAAITLTGDYDLALNNRAWSDGLMNLNNISGVSGGWPAIITCARYPRFCTLRGNTVSNSWGEGISTFEATNTVIEDNVSYNNQQNFYISDTKYTIMRRNLSYCTPGNAIDPYMTQNGILVGDERGVLINGVRYPSSNNTIANNIVMGCDRNLAAGTKVSTNNLYAYNTFVNSGGDSSEKANVLIYASGSCTNCRFINNLILQETSNPISLGGGINNGWTFSSNLWSRAPGSNFRGSGDIIANPYLAKLGLTGPGQLTGNYFKLTANSPARYKAKVMSEVLRDFFQQLRSQPSDIGALEY